MSRRFLAATVLVLALFVVVSFTFSQTVVSRTRVGHQTEGSAYVSTGTLAGNIVVLDGYDIFAFPLEAPRKGPGFTKAFDIKSLPIVGHPNGVAYIPQDRIFVFTEGWSPDKLFLADNRGKSLGTITVTYLNGWMPNHVEGIAYIPPTSPIYPDHFVTAAVDWSVMPYHQHLEVINRQGQVEIDIHPAAPPPIPPNWADNMLGGVEFLPGGTLLCGLNDNLVEYAFDGSIIRWVPFNSPTSWFEGITRLPDGTFAGVGFASGTVTFLSASLARTPALDRDFLFAPGLLGYQAIAWNTDTGDYLLRSNTQPVTSAWIPAIWSLPQSLSTVSQLFGLDQFPYNHFRQMVYMPDEHLLAILFRQGGNEGGTGTPPHPDIHLFDSWGNLVNTVHITAEQYPMARNNIPQALTYIPSTHQFVIGRVQVTIPDPNNPSPVITPTPYAVVVNRDGSVARTIDLTAAGMPNGPGLATHFQTADGEDRLLFTRGRLMVVTGLGGIKLQDFDWRTSMGLLNVPYVSRGPNPATFALMDAGEFIVFDLNPPRKKK